MKRILTAAGLAVIAGSTALAQVERPKFNLESIQQKAREVSDAEFKKMDKNNDGQISKDEYMEAMIAETMRKYEAAFKQIDQDGDDNISKQEYEDFMNFATNKIHQMMQAINK